MPTNWGNVVQKEGDNIIDQSPFLDSTISGEVGTFDGLKAPSNNQMMFQK